MTYGNRAEYKGKLKFRSSKDASEYPHGWVPAKGLQKNSVIEEENDKWKLALKSRLENMEQN